MNLDGPDWIDITVPVKTGMARWSGDIPVKIRWRREMAKGDDYNLTALSMSAHAGTHIDAPLHFIPGGQSIDLMPPDTMIGPARVIECPDSKAITVAELTPHKIARGERILFKTKNSAIAWKRKTFYKDYVYLTDRAADYVAQIKVRAVAIDYLSIAEFQAGTYTHQKLLGAGVWVIEGVNLSGVAPGNYYLVCVPLRIAGAEGSPARAFIKPKP